MSLSDAAIRRIGPVSKPVKKADGFGLYLLVQPNGSRLWRMNYTSAGRQRTLAFGAYPAVSLSEARERRDAAKRQLRDGIDPGAAVKLEKQAAAASTANSFRTVSADWYQRKMVAEHRSPSTLLRADWLLATLNEGLGDRPLAEIEAPELLDVLRRVEAAGHHETVSRLRAVASQIFRYGIATGKCRRDPASDLRGATTSAVATPRSAIVDPAGVGKLLRAIDGYQRRPRLRLALQLLALTFVRPGNATSAEWSEFDIDAGVWAIPADKMKMRTPHRVPLSRQALAVLDQLRKLTSSEIYLFESSKRGTPIGTKQINRVLEEVGFASDQATGHGFRATASTILNESGLWPVDVIELQLAHQERNRVRRVYNRAERWPERVGMMQFYADHLDKLRERGKVVPLPKKTKSQRK
jgi:integrase